MEEVKLNLNLPYVEEDIIEKYHQNMKHIEITLLKVLGRDLDDTEKHKLKQVCMELAISQVTIKYKDELGIDK